VRCSLRKKAGYVSTSTVTVELTSAPDFHSPLMTAELSSSLPTNSEPCLRALLILVVKPHHI
jgi:hypothetical protein